MFLANVLMKKKRSNDELAKIYTHQWTHKTESWQPQIDRLKGTTCSLSKKCPYSHHLLKLSEWDKTNISAVNDITCCGDTSKLNQRAKCVQSDLWKHTAQTPHLSIKLIWHQHTGLYENKCQLSRQGQFNLSSHEMINTDITQQGVSLRLL